jgi:hypothetical protein
LLKQRGERYGDSMLTLAPRFDATSSLLDT